MPLHACLLPVAFIENLAPYRIQSWKEFSVIRIVTPVFIVLPLPRQPPFLPSSFPLSSHIAQASLLASNSLALRMTLTFCVRPQVLGFHGAPCSVYAVLGMEPRAPRMLREHSPAELHSQPSLSLLFLIQGGKPRKASLWELSLVV